MCGAAISQSLRRAFWDLLWYHWDENLPPLPKIPPNPFQHGSSALCGFKRVQEDWRVLRWAPQRILMKWIELIFISQVPFPELRKIISFVFYSEVFHLILSNLFLCHLICWKRLTFYFESLHNKKVYLWSCKWAERPIVCMAVLGWPGHWALWGRQRSCSFWWLWVWPMGLNLDYRGSWFRQELGSLGIQQSRALNKKTFQALFWDAPFIPSAPWPFVACLRALIETGNVQSLFERSALWIG